MPFGLDFESSQPAQLKVVGVGGAGNNAVNRRHGRRHRHGRRADSCRMRKGTGHIDDRRGHQAFRL